MQHGVSSIQKIIRGRVALVVDDNGPGRRERNGGRRPPL
ncbi:hypothetical protein C3B79_1412 [Aeromonas hydrophila]|nr:hypothetical protein C3B79_1412 [Aeromonas hydrophila]